MGGMDAGGRSQINECGALVGVSVVEKGSADDNIVVTVEVDIPSAGNAETVTGILLVRLPCPAGGQGQSRGRSVINKSGSFPVLAKIIITGSDNNIMSAVTVHITCGGDTASEI
jgi:hypothetical protein